MERLAKSYQELVEDDEATVPEDAMEQLESAAKAVYRSWMSERACTYRRLEHLDDLRGTAVTVQAMVFGNRGPTSGAGVAFSRDPSTGAAQPVIDVLFGSKIMVVIPTSWMASSKSSNPCPSVGARVITLPAARIGSK